MAIQVDCWCVIPTARPTSELSWHACRQPNISFSDNACSDWECVYAVGCMLKEKCDWKRWKYAEIRKRGHVVVEMSRCDGSVVAWPAPQVSPEKVELALGLFSLMLRRGPELKWTAGEARCGKRRFRRRSLTWSSSLCTSRSHRRSQASIPHPYLSLPACMNLRRGLSLEERVAIARYRGRAEEIVSSGSGTSEQCHRVVVRKQCIDKEPQKPATRHTTAYYTPLSPSSAPLRPILL